MFKHPHHHRAGRGTISPKPKGPVTQKHQRTRGCNSHLKAEFCHAQIFGSGASTALPLWLRGVVGATRKDVRTAGSVFLTTTLHPMHSKMQTVVPLIQPGTKTMTHVPPATSATPTQAHQLFADACNCAAMARWYTQRGNIAAATRKARQHLAALRQLAKLEGGAA